MKNTVKTTAAVLAAIMAMSCTSVTAFADSTADIISDETAYTDMLTGGWAANDGAISMSKNPEAKAAFKKATASLVGVKYQAIAVLGTQVVAGTNYAVLVRSTAVYPDAQPEIQVMYIYEDLEGGAEITGFQTIIGEQLPGGFTANGGKLGIKNNKTVYKTYKKAMKGLVGVSYSPAAYLGSQVVAGTNYMVLCRSKGTYPGAQLQWSLVTVNKDLNGKSSLVDIETLELGNYDDSNEEGAPEMTSIANPWTEYATVSEAARAAVVELTAPEKLGAHKLTDIQAMKGIVDLRYTKGENTITLRKGTGTDDISGDYNSYKNVTEKKINGNTVALKSNGSGVRAAIWTDGKNSYSVFSDNELSEKFMEIIISQIG